MRNFQKNSENWFDRHGVDRPKHDPHLTEAELAEAFEKIKQNTRHGQWTQMGNRLTCNNCQVPHTTEPIPVEYLLQGTDEKGLPILTKIS